MNRPRPCAKARSTPPAKGDTLRTDRALRGIEGKLPLLGAELQSGIPRRIIDPRVLGSLLFAVALTSPESPVMRCYCQERCCLLSEDVDKAYRGLQRVKRLNSITTNEGVPER